ncbi:basic salivary proline-rich protein 2-like [Strigops habroptila]|uniref:basic salivary proline-rich protein 2-like n=1 Tax=Strigops habroptila TaxID=2489341 RepID=UPI0011CF1AE6|nr:basic salivary proline-rich protein 2-like [Strigops habroptila]
MGYNPLRKYAKSTIRNLNNRLTVMQGSAHSWEATCLPGRAREAAGNERRPRAPPGTSAQGGGTDVAAKAAAEPLQPARPSRRPSRPAVPRRRAQRRAGCTAPGRPRGGKRRGQVAAAAAPGPPLPPAAPPGPLPPPPLEVSLPRRGGAERRQEGHLATGEAGTAAAAARPHSPRGRLDSTPPETSLLRLSPLPTWRPPRRRPQTPPQRPARPPRRRGARRRRRYRPLLAGGRRSTRVPPPAPRVPTSRPRRGRDAPGASTGSGSSVVAPLQAPSSAEERGGPRHTGPGTPKGPCGSCSERGRDTAVGEGAR